MQTRRAALTAKTLCSCHSTAPACSWLGFAAAQGKACDFYVFLFWNMCHFDCPRYMDHITWMKAFMISDCPPHKTMHQCLGAGNLATTARCSRSFVSAQASQLLPEFYLRSSRNLFMRKDKPEAKGDPDQTVPSPTRHSPTGPKKDQAGNGIHQPSGFIPRQGELMPHVWGYSRKMNEKIRIITGQGWHICSVGSRPK